MGRMVKAARRWAWAAICLCGFSWAAAGPEVSVHKEANQLVLKTSFPAPRFEGATGGEQVRVGTLPLKAETPGAPRLPVAEFTVVIPEGMAIESIQIVGTPTPLPGAHRLAWGQRPLPIGSPAVAANPADPGIYRSDSAFPANAIRLAGTGTWRGYRLATLVVHPVQYRPSSGTVLAWASLEARLVLRTESKSQLDSLQPRGLDQDRAELRSLAVNPEESLNYRAAKSSLASEPYLIVCPEVLKPAFERLLAHREANGMPGRIMTTESIVSSFPGLDAAEKVRAAIKEAYQTRGTNFVLLGGDDVDDSGNMLVPIRGALLNANGERYEKAPIDLYFGALDGTWDTDLDGIYGEPEEIDYFPEVHIGRATVETVEEANRWIDKVLKYEQGLPEQRRTDLVWMGESLDSTTFGDDSKDVTATLVPADEYQITRLYARPGTFSRENVIANLNRGPHLTNHLGHANETYVMGIYNSDVDALTNDSPFFSYSQGCMAGAFDQAYSGNGEAISEHFLTAVHGAFGVVMNARYGWYEPNSTNGPSQYFDNEFYDALFTEGLTTLGEANDDSRLDNVAYSQTDDTMRWCFLEVNLHGDPATPVHVGGRLKVVSERVIEDNPLYGNANGQPDPGETIQLAVTLRNQRQDPVEGIEAFLSSDTPGVTIRDGYAAWPNLNGTTEAENLAPNFTAKLDVGCGRYAHFTLTIRYKGCNREERGTFSVLIGQRTQKILFSDQFETDQGWTVSGDAVDGAWERGVPKGTVFNGQPANPDKDGPDEGDKAYVTGNQGISATDDDVDIGTTTLTSPVLDATGFLELNLAYDSWVFISPTSTPMSDKMTVEVSGDGGQSWKTLETTNTRVRWLRKTYPLGNLFPLGAGLQMRVSTTDYKRIHQDVVVETGLDHVVFEGVFAACQPFSGSGAVTPPAPVGDTLRLTRQQDCVRLDWRPVEAEPGHAPAEYYQVTTAGKPNEPFQLLGEPSRPLFLDQRANPAGSYSQFLVTAQNSAGSETP